MRFATVRYDGRLVPGRVEGDEIVLLDAENLIEVMKADYEVEATGDTVAWVEADLAPVIPKPDKIVCVGVNYKAHIEEMGREAPDAPTYFAKYARALIGANDDIVLPTGRSTDIDWECELAIVIGRETRNVDRDGALAHIAGYTVLNDVSVRDYQRRTSQFLAGKTFESLTPVGPVMVTTDELGDGSGLTLSTMVNGEIKQSATTSDLAFDCLDIVADLSRILTLDPGDIIATGTPGGVGAARTPPEWLQPGDELITEVERIGRLVNRCR